MIARSNPTAALEVEPLYAVEQFIMGNGVMCTYETVKGTV